MSRQKKKQRKQVGLNNLTQINHHAAGLDIGAREIWACIPEHCEAENVRRFETHTAGLQQLTSWLQQHRIETVAMESTGVYWIPIYEMLEGCGMAVWPGECTGGQECQWTQK